MGVAVYVQPTVMPRMVFLEGPWKQSQSRVRTPHIHHWPAWTEKGALAIVLVKQSRLHGNKWLVSVAMRVQTGTGTRADAQDALLTPACFA